MERSEDENGSEREVRIFFFFPSLRVNNFGVCVQKKKKRRKKKLLFSPFLRILLLSLAVEINAQISTWKDVCIYSNVLMYELL